MFSFTTGMETTVPKIASSRPVRTDSPDSYDSVNFENGVRKDKVPSPSPLDPRRSMLNNPLPALPQQQQGRGHQQQPGRLSTQDHSLRNKLSFEVSSSSEAALTAPHHLHDHPAPQNHSRNLTPTAPSAKPVRHDRNDSLTVVPRRAHKQRTGSGDSSNGGLRRSSAFLRRSSVVEDEDANIVRRSIKRELVVPTKAGSTSSGASQGRERDKDSGWEEQVGSGNSSVQSFLHEKRNAAKSPQQQTKSLPKPAPPKPQRSPSPMEDADDNLFDSTLSASAAIASRYEESSTRNTPQPKKVMNRAEFERYQKERAAEASDSSDSEQEASDDESERERQNQMAKQREKQNAHLSVFRQQVRKISGTQGAELNSGFQRTNSAPLLNQFGGAGGSTGNLPTFNVVPSPGEPDSDEDVPLGILAAHGFPSKTRPPSQLPIARNLQHTSSHPNLRQSAMMGNGNLPVFARNLPADPYYGAGLVQQHPVRMSMGFGIGQDMRSQASGSVYGGPPGTNQTTKEDIKAAMARPGGLIGEIALAEEQKAARRGAGNRSPYRSTSPSMADINGGTGVGVLGMGSAGGPPPGPRPASTMMGMGMGMQQGGMLGMGGGHQLGMQPGMNGSMGTLNDSASMQLQMQMMQMKLEMTRLQEQLARTQSSPAVPQVQQFHPQQQFLQPTPQTAYAQSRTMSLSDPLLNRPQSYAPSVHSMAPPSFAPSNNRASFMPAPSMAAPQIPAFTPLINKAYTPSLAPSERSTVGQPSRYRPVSHMGGSVSGGGSQAGRTRSGLGGVLRASGLRRSAEEGDEESWGDVKEKRERNKKK